MYNWKNFILIGLLFILTGFVRAQQDSIQEGSIQSLLKEGSYKTVIDSIEPTLSNNTTFSSYYNLGIAYEKSGFHYKALWAFENALKIDPSSSEAQHNANFVFGKIAKNEEWEHPFSWTERMIVAFSRLWTPLLIVSMIILALIVFLRMGKVTVNKANWIQKSWLLWLLLAVIALFSINKLNNHFTHHQRVIIENREQPVFLSPNGIPAEDKIELPIRATVNSYSEDSSYISILLGKETYWINNERTLVY